MNEIWDRIEAWLAEHAPAVLAGLNGPATEQKIDAAERALGVTLPEDVRASYRRHNGQSDDTPLLYARWEFFTLGQICHEWELWTDLLRRGDFDTFTVEADPQYVRCDHWFPAWVPIARDIFGNCVCADTDPGPLGTFGQLVRVMPRDWERPILATGIREWLCTFADELEKGDYFFDPDSYHGLQCRDEEGS